jgi:acyl-CoA dehydrogenase
MELTGLTPDERRFQDEVRQFYAENMTPEFRRAGQMVTWAFSEIDYGRAWQKILHKKGWGAPTWPVEYGGTGWTPVQHYIFEMETIRASPPIPDFIGQLLCAPCIMQFGTPEQKAKYLPAMLAGDDIWAQGYSEPGSGSDLAALQLKAVPDGEDYILNGSKIWTTYAHHANRFFALVRTSNEGRKHAGITFLLGDMDNPGIKVRPLINLAGDHEFNQVFFTDARVPKWGVLGAENEGWKVARYLLQYEHGGGFVTGELRRRLAWVAEIASIEEDGEGGRLIDDPDFSRRLAEHAIAIETIDFAERTVLSALREGDPPPPALPLIRIRSRDVAQMLTEMAMDAVAYYGAPFQPEARLVHPPGPAVGPDHAVMPMSYYLTQRAATIAGGTPEIQRNNLARALLKL